MSNITIAEISYLTLLKENEQSVNGGFSQKNRFGLGVRQKGKINQATIAAAQGNNKGGDQVVIANAQANLAVGRKNRQKNKGNFWVVL